MKRTRKGFTLVELLIVIGIMGILGTMGMIAGQEATSAARATAIADNLEKAATAMMMYYAEDSENIDKNGLANTTNDDEEVTMSAAAKLAAGANAYIKDGYTLAYEDDNTANNTYFVAIDGTAPAQTWWIAYKFSSSTGDTQIKKAMVNKVNRMGLKGVKGDNGTAFTDSDNTVYMKVR